MFKIFILLACFLFSFCQFPTSNENNSNYIIAFISNNNIHLMYLNNGKSEKLLSKSGKYSDLVFSPYNNKFAFVTDVFSEKDSLNKKRMDLVIKELRNDRLINLTKQKFLNIERPFFSSSEKSIYFIGIKGVNERSLYKINLDGSNLNRISNQGELIQKYKISSNEEYILYTKIINDPKETYLFLKKTTEEIPINLTSDLKGSIFDFCIDNIKQNVLFIFYSYPGFSLFKIDLNSYQRKSILDDSGYYYHDVMILKNYVFLSYSIFHGPNLALGLVDTDRQKIVVIDNKSNSEYFHTSLDGTKILYTNQNSRNIKILDSNTLEVWEMPTKFSNISYPVFLY